MTNSKFCCFFVSFLYASLALCQEHGGFRRLGVNEGLSQNSVREIFQDRQGFIWIGTADGLNRYDGRRIKKFRESFRDKSAKRLPGKLINGKIMEDGHRNLWMIVDGRVVRMNLPTESFSIVKKVGGDLECRILALYENKLFISTPKEVVLLDVSSHRSQSIPLTGVFAVAQSKRGPDILFKQGNSIYRYNLKAKQTSLVLTTGTKALLSPALCNNNSLLFTSQNKLNDYNINYHSITASYDLPYDHQTNQQLIPLSTAKTPEGTIVATVPNKGLVLIDSVRGTFHHYKNAENHPFSLSSDLIYTSMIDHSGNLWLGTEGGGISILNLRPSLFSAFPSQAVINQQSAYLMVKAIYFDEPNIYIGTYSRGLYEVNRFTRQYRQLFHRRQGADSVFTGIFFIKKDFKGQIWMNVGGRVGIADLQRATFINSVEIEYSRKGKSHNILQCFTPIDSNKYILGTFHSTYLIDNKNGVLTVKDLGLVDHRLEGDIQCVYAKENGDVIIGKGEGKGYLTVHIDTNNAPRILETGLNDLTIKYVYRDTLRKAFWFATNVGIVIQYDDQKKLRILDELDGLSNDFVYTIQAQDDHHYWISTNKGLNKITFEAGKLLKVTGVEQYNIQHGLQSNEFNTGAYFKRDHLLFFGGVTGINWFDERRFYTRTFAAKTFLTDLLINEKPLQSDSIVNFLKTIRLSHHENNLVLKFATLDYTNPLVNQYQYRLKNYDKQWVNAGQTAEARYSRLGHGTYFFEVRASDSEGVWSAASPLIELTIVPPFWLTWWFKMVVVLALAAMLALGIRYYLKRKLDKQMRQMEKQLAVNNERLRISRDMHDELGTGLSKIALLSEVGKNSGHADKRIINEIGNTSRGLADKMGEIVWTLNPQNDSLGNLAAYLKEYIYDATESLPVSVVIHFPDQIPDISLGHLHRQQLMLVTKEALNNALKYAGATQISFTLVTTRDRVLFYLVDNGVGFDTTLSNPSKNGKRNGLSNMKIRMESIGGYFSIHAENGTEISYGLHL